MSEFEFEPIKGFPQKLPEGERLLWQGAPAWRSVARHILKIRAVCLYFGAILTWRIISGVLQEQTFQTVAISFAWILALAAVTVGFLALVSRLIATSTVYSITTRRVAMRFGLAFPMTLNVPFRIILGAAVKAHADGTGDLPLRLNGDGRLAYLHLWPHARPWRLASPEPMFRCIADRDAAAAILAAALKSFHGAASPQGVSEGSEEVFRPRETAAA